MGAISNVVKYGYECNRCGLVVEAESWESTAKPEGYYIHVRRVTEALKHRISEELYFCSKDCLLDGMKYGITHSTTEVKIF